MAKTRAQRCFSGLEMVTVCGIEIESVSDRGAVVVARNCDDTLTLSVGHLFTEAVTWEPWTGKGATTIKTTQPVQLRLMKIQLFGKDLESLSPGYRARLVLEGSALALEEEGGLR